jgi:hypothetical protein
MDKRIFLIAVLGVGVLGVTGAPAAVVGPAGGRALLPLSLLQDARTIIVTKCKINGHWQPGRCPAPDSKVRCVHHRTEAFRHAGHCRGPSV